MENVGRDDRSPEKRGARSWVRCIREIAKNAHRAKVATAAVEVAETTTATVAKLEQQNAATNEMTRNLSQAAHIGGSGSSPKGRAAHFSA